MKLRGKGFLPLRRLYRRCFILREGKADNWSLSFLYSTLDQKYNLIMILSKTASCLIMHLVANSKDTGNFNFVQGTCVIFTGLRPSKDIRIRTLYSVLQYCG